MNVVERIGSGIRRNRGLCREYGLETPEIEASGSWVTMTFPRRTGRDGRGIGARVPDRIANTEDPLSGDALRWLTGQLARPGAQVTAQVIWHCRMPRTARESMAALDLKHPKTFRTNYLRSLLKAGWLEMTVPDRPTSGEQRYALTARGRELLAALKAGDGDPPQG